MLFPTVGRVPADDAVHSEWRLCHSSVRGSSPYSQPSELRKRLFSSCEIEAAIAACVALTHYPAPSAETASRFHRWRRNVWLDTAM
jgi:hypothetical protein